MYLQPVWQLRDRLLQEERHEQEVQLGHVGVFGQQGLQHRESWEVASVPVDLPNGGSPSSTATHVEAWRRQTGPRTSLHLKLLNRNTLTIMKQVDWGGADPNPGQVGIAVRSNCSRHPISWPAVMSCLFNLCIKPLCVFVDLFCTANSTCMGSFLIFGQNRDVVEWNGRRWQPSLMSSCELIFLKIFTLLLGCEPVEWWPPGTCFLRLFENWDKNLNIFLNHPSMFKCIAYTLAEYLAEIIFVDFDHWWLIWTVHHLFSLWSSLYLQFIRQWWWRVKKYDFICSCLPSNYAVVGR